MTVFRHGPANCNLRILDRFAVSSLDLEFPGLQLVNRYRLEITCVCYLECSCLRNHGLCVSSFRGRLYQSACGAVLTFAVFTTIAATLAVGLAVAFSLACFAMFALAVLAALTALAVTLTITAFVPCFAVAFSLAAISAFAIFPALAAISVFTVLAVAITLVCRTVSAFTILTAVAFCGGIDRSYYRRTCHGPDKENGKKNDSKFFQHKDPPFNMIV